MTTSVLLRATILLMAALALPPSIPAAPLGTAINYQGYLAEKNKPANGLYDFTFQLYDAATGGSLVGSPTTVSLNGVPVTNGLFSTALDFGSSDYTVLNTGFPFPGTTNYELTYNVATHDLDLLGLSA